MNFSQTKIKPFVLYTLRLKCPLCGQTDLQVPGRFFEFVPGCGKCQYLFEREDGYFSGSPWMVGYPLVGITLLVICLFVKLMIPSVSSYFLAAIGFFIGAVLSIIGFPWFRAIWMFADLWFHPLTPIDRTQYKNFNNLES